MIRRADFADAPRRRVPGLPGGAPWAVFFVALALRVAYVLASTGLHPQPYADSVDYDQIAWNLAHGAGYSVGEGAAAYATALRPPIVPWLTSLLYRLIGHQYLGALMLQAVIGALIPLLVVALGAVLFGGGVGRVAGWLAAFDPLLVFFSGYLMTETPFSVALLAAIVASVTWVRTPRPGRALGAGLLWGLAVLTRPTAMLAPLVIALWAWRPLGLSIRPGDRARQLAMLTLGVVVVVAPWTIRNAIVFRSFIPVTTSGGRVLFESNNEVVWNDPARRGGQIAVFDIEPYASRYRGRSEVEWDGIGRALAVDFLKRHVRDWPAMAWAKFARFWRLTAEGGGTGTWNGPGSPITSLRRAIDPLLLWSVPILPLAVWGLVRSLRGPRRWYQSIPALLIGYFTLLALIYWGSLRMRMPIEPLVVLLAALGFEDVRRRWRARRIGLGLVGAESEPSAAGR
jgi:4-amino-4-deoxy-L-arabinose transferase-like glycosyltransferase